MVPALGCVAASCSTGDGSTANAEAPASVIPISPLPLPTPASAAPTDVAVLTTMPLTIPPTLAPTVPDATTVPPTTEAPTTTAEPTTSTSTTTTTTTTTLPPNVEVVEPFTQQLQAVGTRDGDATRWVQLRLIQLGFWNSSADGRYGLTTKQAVMAFQKYIGLPATGAVDEATALYLTNMTQRGHGTTNTGDLVEIDKTKQLLFIVRGGKTLWILNTSTGNGQPYVEKDKNTPGELQTGISITSPGLWKVYLERPEGWWEGDLGQIYRPKYFHGGQAVHGSNNIPNYPASHGCVRISVPAMDWIWAENLMPKGITVWVHGG